MGIGDLLKALGDEVSDPEEESFLLFSQSLPSQDLGFVDVKTSSLELTVAGKDLVIHQSPTILASNRAEGTTGAVVWKVTPLFAEWIASADNILFRQGILHSHSTALELGCGISGIVALALGPKVKKYVATDQDYALKLLKQNIADNSQNSSYRNEKGKAKTTRKAARAASATATGNIQIMALDWELDSLSTLPELLQAETPDVRGSAPGGVGALIACDCIYNEALIEPFVKTCNDICRLRRDSTENTPTICIVAQQLRSSQVFEVWLSTFHSSFHVWRVPENLLTEGLKENSGFVVHIGILRS